MTPSRSSGCLVALRVVATLAGTLLLVAVVVRLFWVLGIEARTAVQASGPDSPADLLLLGVSLLGGFLAAWVGASVVLSALAVLPGAVGRAAAALARWLAPAVVRRGVALALGTALAAGLPAAAHADSVVPGPVATSVAPSPDPAFTVTGVPSATPPDPAFDVTGQPTAASEPPVATPVHGLGPLGPAPRQATSSQSGSGSVSGSVSGSAATVTVVRGDSLWRIAARHLGSRASVAQIAREWPRWYAANRAVVGPDPDRISVGQVLTVPPEAPAPSPGAAS